MPSQLIKQSISAPGFLGINSQDSGEDSDIRFAKIADNVVFDSAGRIAARKGWTSIAGPVGAVSASGPSEYGIAEYSVGEFGAPTLFKFIYEFVKEGDNVIISGGGNILYTGIGNSIAPVTVRNADNSGNATYSITADHWQAVSLPYGDGAAAEPHAYLVQGGHDVLVYHELPTSGGNPHDHDSGSFGFQKLDDVGTLPVGYSSGSFRPNCGLAAYGRIWLADIANDKQTVYFSRLLDGSDFSGGDSGFLSLNAVFPSNDEIVALAAHNGFLIIFGKNNIAIYQNPIDVTRLELADFIPNVGCINRDTVQNTGTDIVFLSKAGLLSLQRVIQEKSLPFRDLSKNIRDEFLANIANEQTVNLKSGYVVQDALYLLTLPSTGIVYAFDMRSLLPDGAARVTTWTGILPTSFWITEANELVFSDGSYLGKYTGYNDNGQDYRFRYYTNYTNLADPSRIKILKKLGFTARGESNKQFYTFWGFDYKEDYRSANKTLPGSLVYEYGIGEFGVAEFGAGGTRNDSFLVPASGNGSTVQVGLEADVNGNYLALQKIDIFAKQGKVL